MDVIENWIGVLTRKEARKISTTFSSKEEPVAFEKASQWIFALTLFGSLSVYTLSSSTTLNFFDWTKQYGTTPIPLKYPVYEIIIATNQIIIATNQI